MAGGAMDLSDKMGLKRTKALSANYVGGNGHIAALGKNEPSFLSRSVKSHIGQDSLYKYWGNPLPVN